MTTTDPTAPELRRLLADAERESRRLFYAIVALVVVVVVAGTVAFVKLGDLTRSNGRVLRQVDARQQEEIDRLRADLAYYEQQVVPAFTAYVQDLIRKLSAAGGEPGTLVIPPRPTPSPGR